MIAEVVAGLVLTDGGRYLDATFGGGGHTRALLEQCGPQGQVLGMDRDPSAIAHGRSMAGRYAGRLHLYQGPFAQLAKALEQCGWDDIQGALFDLGVSSQQLDTAQRGFSFRADGPLDMRMDQGMETRITAADMVNQMDVWELTKLFFSLGEEPRAKRAAHAIVQARSRERLTSTRQLAALLEACLPPPRPGLHPATRIFQALRMAVNQELEQLESGLKKAMDYLATGGRIAVISFHSLEDRVVKRIFKDAALPPRVQGPMGLLPQPEPKTPPFRLVVRKPLTPSREEIGSNPRARSAKLRIIERAHSSSSRGL
ncbi:MAG: 16S rRNA (cytosine(1402)-N(4))-methyltransferase RsmH [Magnetococcales bacterium]|nr:16S rRNA (cytosine(1402)-N(4))-methyltransferase RsmH [Magnetococcales bacterium]